MPFTLRDDSQHFDRYSMLFRLQLAAAFGCVILFLYSLQFTGPGFLHLGASLRVAAVGTLTAGASLFLGFLLGFIFCIPRTAKPTGAAGPASFGADAKTSIDASSHSAAMAVSAVETNSNLVDISDWLTKILVGVGLVELNKIPSVLRRLSEFLAPGLSDGAPNADLRVGRSFAVGIVIFFFGVGFLIGYLWTRLYFQRALSELVDLARQVEADKAWLDATRAELLMHEGQLDEAMRESDSALQTNPMNPKALFVKARILKRLAQVGDKSGDKALLREAVHYASRAAALLPTHAAPLYNMACYQALLGSEKAEVLKNLRRAIQLNPKLRDEARVEAETEGDFYSLRDDNDFKEIVKPPSKGV